MKLDKLFLACACTAASGLVAAHGDEDLRSGNLHPRIGLMSESVVKEKFRTYGYSDVELLQEGDNWLVRAKSEGQPVELKMNAMTGALHGAEVARVPVTPAAMNVIQPQPQRVPWIDRAIKFDQIGTRGLSPP